MANFFQALIGLFSTDAIPRTLETLMKGVEDVDKRNALVMQFLTMKEETERARLNKSTIPWVDAVHKMGRQIFWLTFILVLGVLIALGHGPELIQYANLFMAAAGGGGAYTLLKGRGQ